VGLLLGGMLTEYLSWRWTLYVNLVFAGAGFIGGALLLSRQQSTARPRLDIPGVVLVSGALCTATPPRSGGPPGFSPAVRSSAEPCSVPD